VKRGAQAATPPEQSNPQEIQQSPDPATGLASPSPSNASTTTAAPGLTQAPAAPWRGHGGGAWGRCSSPYPHGLLRPLLPGPSGARARLSRQQQSLVRAPRHGPHWPPGSAGAEASAHAASHGPLRRPQAAGGAGGHRFGALRRLRPPCGGVLRGPVSPWTFALAPQLWSARCRDRRPRSSQRGGQGTGSAVAVIAPGGGVGLLLLPVSPWPPLSPLALSSSRLVWISAGCGSGCSMPPPARLLLAAWWPVPWPPVALGSCRPPTGPSRSGGSDPSAPPATPPAPAAAPAAPWPAPRPAAPLSFASRPPPAP
jgi:hypothetical protein